MCVCPMDSCARGQPAPDPSQRGVRELISRRTWVFTWASLPAGYVASVSQVCKIGIIALGSYDCDERKPRKPLAHAP